MMKPQASSSGQSSGQNENQKKSVFDRLGHQLDIGRQMKRRPSPGQYGDYGPPPMHDDYGRYGGRDGRSQAEMEWRYQNERRMMPPFPGRDRHLPPPPMQQHPHPPLPHQPPHYDMEMGNRQQPPYYPHPGPYQGSMPPPMAPGSMTMPMHQQRSSPKYDRMPNIGPPNFKHRNGPPRMGPIEHNQCMSPPRNFMPPGPPAPPQHLGPHDMPPMAPDGLGSMFPNSYRWPDNMDPDYMMNHGNRMMMEEQFEPAISRRYKQQQQSQQPSQMLNPQSHNHPPPISEAPRYTRWRERRDVITNLDRETARSSSRTDSLKSSLQQSDSKNSLLKSSKKLINLDSTQSAASNLPSSASKSEPEQHKQKAKSSSKNANPGQSNEKDTSNEESNKNNSTKTDPQDISDGEIVDDEDSSDDEELVKGDSLGVGQATTMSNYRTSRGHHLHDPYGGGRESHQFYENGKRRRMLEREDYSMDYETISDEDLDDFMGDKKISDLHPDDVKLCNRNGGDKESKTSSEIELLNALGLDWANLVEIAKQSRTPNKESSSPSPRFSMANYLPTLGITADLAGPELYDLVTKVCRTSHDHYQ